MEIKEELKQDEELLVRVFKLEKFVKKYKKSLIIGGIILAVLLVGYKTYSYIQTQEIKKENNALDTLVQNPNDKNALKILKKDKKLYDLYLFQKGEFSKITTGALQAVKAYSLAMRKGDKSSLENYLLNPNYHILKDSVRFTLMRIYLKNGNRKKAKEMFGDIDSNSRYKDLGVYLLHYGITK